MEYPDYLRQLMKELTAKEFLTVTLKKLDEINIETEEELLLLDKVLYKSSNISKEYKMQLLTPQLQEKFNQRMADMKLDQNNFLNMLKTYEGKGPYPKKDTPVTITPEVQDKAPEPNLEPPTSDKKYHRSNRSVERTPKRNRSNSSSSTSSSSGSEDRRSSKDERSSEKKSTRVPAKYSFSMKKQDSSPRVVRSHDQDEYFERGSRGYDREPRSERGEGSGRDYHRHSPDLYFSGRPPPRVYRGTKRFFRSPRGYSKH